MQKSPGGQAVHPVCQGIFFGDGKEDVLPIRRKDIFSDYFAWAGDMKQSFTLQDVKGYTAAVRLGDRMKRRQGEALNPYPASQL